MRHNIFFVLVLILLSTLINYKNFSSADEVWTIKKYKRLAYARVSGEVQHGDALNFFILINLINKTFIYYYMLRYF